MRAGGAGGGRGGDGGAGWLVVPATSAPASGVDVGAGEDARGASCGVLVGSGGESGTCGSVDAARGGCACGGVVVSESRPWSMAPRSGVVVSIASGDAAVAAVTAAAAGRETGVTAGGDVTRPYRSDIVREAVLRVDGAGPPAPPPLVVDGVGVTVSASPLPAASPAASRGDLVGVAAVAGAAHAPPSSASMRPSAATGGAGAVAGCVRPDVMTSPAAALSRDGRGVVASTAEGASPWPPDAGGGVVAAAASG